MPNPANAVPITAKPFLPTDPGEETDPLTKILSSQGLPPDSAAVQRLIEYQQSHFNIPKVYKATAEQQRQGIVSYLHKLGLGSRGILV